jgi:class 3 adenylate cyclase
MKVEGYYLAKRDHDALRCIAQDAGTNWLEKRRDGTFLIAILDGSDQYAERHGELRAYQKEQLHLRVSRRAIESRGGLVAEFKDRTPYFRDASIGCFDGKDSFFAALSAALAIHRFLGDWNEEHGLGWEEQVHSRLGVSRFSFLDALACVQQAQRREIILAEGEEELLSLRERQLLDGAANIRSGLPTEFWNALCSDKPYEIIERRVTVHVGLAHAIKTSLQMETAEEQNEIEQCVA